MPTWPIAMSFTPAANLIPCSRGRLQHANRERRPGRPSIPAHQSLSRTTLIAVALRRYAIDADVQIPVSARACLCQFPRFVRLDGELGIANGVERAADFGPGGGSFDERGPLSLGVDEVANLALSRSTSLIAAPCRLLFAGWCAVFGRRGVWCARRRARRAPGRPRACRRLRRAW